MTSSALLPLRIEAAYTGTVYDVLAGASVTWTDICDYVLFADGVTFNRGRTSEATSTSAGSLSFAIKTAPDGSTAALTLRMPIRVSWYDAVHYSELAALFSDYADYAAAVAAYESEGGTGTWRPLWTGSVSEIRAGWQGGVRGVQQVSCADNVAVAERTELGAWPTAAATSIGGLHWFYPLDDKDAESPLREATGSVTTPLRVRSVGVTPENSSVTLGSASAPANDGTAAAFIGTTAAGGWMLEATDALGNLPNSGVDDFTISAYVWVDDVVGRDTVVVSFPWDGARNFALDVGVASGNKPYVGWTRPGGSERVDATAALSRGQWHHIAVRVEVSAGTLFDVELFLDGASTGTPYSDFNGPFAAGRYGYRIGAGWNNNGPFAGRIAGVGLFDAALSNTDIATLAGARNGYDQDSTIARFNRLQRLASFSTSTASGGIGVMGAQPLAGKSVAAAMNDCSTVEHTPWHSTVDGELTLASRATYWNNAQIVAGSPPFLSFAYGLELPGKVIDPSTSIAVDDDSIANVVTGNRVGGLTYTASDTASVGAYGEYRRATTYPCGSDAEMTTYVNYDLATSAQPRASSSSLTVDVVHTQATVDPDDVLATDVGDIIRIVDLPADAPFTSTPYFRVVGMTDRANPSGWSRTFNVELIGVLGDLISAALAPSGAPESWVWKLDDADYPLGVRTATNFDSRLGL